MTATNGFFPFAAGTTANVMTDSEYSSAVGPSGSYVTGVTSGLASSRQANKTWRQSSVMAAAIGQLMANAGISTTDSIPYASLATLLSSVITSLGLISPFSATYAQSMGGYPLGSVVCSDDGSTLYRSTISGNMVDPSESGSGWVSITNGLATEEEVNGKVTSFTDANTDGYDLFGYSNTETAPAARRASTGQWDYFLLSEPASAKDTAIRNAVISGTLANAIAFQRAGSYSWEYTLTGSQSPITGGTSTVIGGQQQLTYIIPSTPTGGAIVFETPFGASPTVVLTGVGCSPQISPNSVSSTGFTVTNIPTGSTIFVYAFGAVNQ